MPDGRVIMEGKHQSDDKFIMEAIHHRWLH